MRCRSATLSLTGSPQGENEKDITYYLKEYLFTPLG